MFEKQEGGVSEGEGEGRVGRERGVERERDAKRRPSPSPTPLHPLCRRIVTVTHIDATRTIDNRSTRTSQLY